MRAQPRESLERPLRSLRLGQRAHQVDDHGVRVHAATTAFGGKARLLVRSEVHHDAASSRGPGGGLTGNRPASRDENDLVPELRDSLRIRGPATRLRPLPLFVRGASRSPSPHPPSLPALHQPARDLGAHEVETPGLKDGLWVSRPRIGGRGSHLGAGAPARHARGARAPQQDVRLPVSLRRRDRPASARGLRRGTRRWKLL